MRSRIFRIVAGLLAVVFIWVVCIADAGQMPLRQAVLAGVIGVAFGLYALLGNDPAERLLNDVFRIHPTDPNKRDGSN